MSQQLKLEQIRKPWEKGFTFSDSKPWFTPNLSRVILVIHWQVPFHLSVDHQLPDWQAAAAEAEEHHNATHRPSAPACPRGVFSPHCTSSSTLMTAPQENHLWNSWYRTMTSTHADRRWCSQNLELNPLKPVKMTVELLEIVYKLQTIFSFLCSFFPFSVSSCKSFGLFSISHFLLSSDSSSVSVGLPSSYSLVKNRFKVFEFRTDVLQLSRTTYLHFSAVRDSQKIHQNNGLKCSYTQ